MVREVITAKEVARQLDVSRETLERLERYVELLLKWQNAINLIGRGTVGDIWHRHILDCGQLCKFLPPGLRPIVDIGSGAGFPGLVLAILGAKDVRLVEADSRKCVFLREAARETKTSVDVIESRIENIRDLSAGVITARALASTGTIIKLSQTICSQNTIYLLLKGKNVHFELTEVKNQWKMDAEIHPSFTDPDGSILIMESVVCVHTTNN